MKFAIATILLAAVSLVSAEDFRVIVGKADNGTNAVVYTPNQVKAKVGDRINFEFHVKNHTATQSSFAEPCTRQRNTATNQLGVDSGFMAVPPDAKEIPVWTIEVKQDNAPIWMFCNQGNHCNSGMVFAINAPEEGEKTFATFLEKAKTANHPDPALGQTADFTPPPAQSSAPPTGSDAPSPSPSDSSAPTESNSTPGTDQLSAGASDSTASGPASTPSIPATADQANASIAPSTSSTPSGSLPAIGVPGAGIALTLAGLLAGMLI